MLTRIAFLALVLAVNIPGCKKGSSLTANAAPGASPKASATVAPTATPIPTPAKPVIDQSAQVIIYGYHRFVKQVHRPDTEITPEMFEGQMKELKDKNIPVIGMQDFLAWKRGEKNIPPKAAIITFDDGWKSQHEIAWAIMKKYGYPFTLFIYTEGVKGGKYGGGEAMSWEQLAEMRDAGIDIQAHSATHQDLRRPYDKSQKKRLNPEEYEQWLDSEIAGSKRTLEQKLGIKVNCFAVPFGFVNEHVREFIKKSDYEAVFTVYGQRLTYSLPNDSLGRYLIEGNKPKVFIEAATFGGSTSGTGTAPVAEVSKANIGAQPADGETITTGLPLIRANLSSFGEIDEKSVQMRVSGLGLVPASYDAKTQTVSYQVTQKLKDKTCTVIVSGKSGDKKVETSWTFNISDGSAPAASPATSPSPGKR